MRRLTELVHRYLAQSGIGKTGSCHVFRHTMATLMLEGGADLRAIQAMLGHAQLTTTEVYTQVSITHLHTVHRRTHPAHQPRMARPPAGVPADAARRALLDAEAEEEASAHHS